MKQTFIKTILISFILVSPQSNAQTGWIQQTSGASYLLTYVEFINASTGFVIEYKTSTPIFTKILRTTNGGQNWLVRATLNNLLLGTMDFVDASTGFIAGTHCFKTTDSGLTWDSVSRMPVPAYANDIFFINSSTGWAACSGSGTSIIYQTTNGGVSWNLQYVSTFGYGMRAVFFTTSLTGYATGITSFNYMFKTTNGGALWTGLVPTIIPGNSLFFTDANTGFNAGESSAIQKTTNAGLTWTTQLLSVPYINLRSVYFVNAGTGYICGWQGKIFKTTNGGTNWIQQAVPVAPDFSSIFFINDVTGYCVGDNGTILKTTSGGITFMQAISNKIPDRFSLSQNYPNPFNPVTKIKFSLPFPSAGGVMQVQLRVYDVLGREIVNLIPPLRGGQEGLSPGTYEVSFDGSNLPSGVYYYQLTISNEQLAMIYSETKKMMLLK